ncbi:MAG: hypothetical protein IPK16_17940 [Anaerolineales bacterium]|nr:hypothetical protein [Anaerolineales bacterium]
MENATAAGAVVATLPAATPIPQPTPAPAAPTCINSMKWVADLNLDDQNMKAPPIMIPGQNFAKGWRVLNDGTCAWPADFALAYTSGNRIEASMGGSSVKVGRAVQPGEQVDITVNLRAPQTYGVFQGFWQLRDTLGQAFGETVWTGIQVPDPNPPPVVVTPPPPVPVGINPNVRGCNVYRRWPVHGDSLECRQYSGGLLH